MARGRYTFPPTFIFSHIAPEKEMRALVLCFALLLCSCQASSPRSQAEGASEFIRRQAGNESVIVFVHGATGNAISTWTNESTGAYWPRLIADDPMFREEDIFVYEYPSPMFGSSYNINELAEDIRLALSDAVIPNHKRIIFVVHSMGGLVVRQYLLKYRDVADQVAFVYFYATPTTGSPMATLATLFSHNPQLGNLRPMKADEYLGNLQRDWLAVPRLRAIPSYCAYETRNTLTVRIVEQESATNLCNRRLDPIDTNHIDIVKPKSVRDKPYLTFRSAYIESLNSKGLSDQRPAVQKSYVAPESVLLQQREDAKSVFDTSQTLWDNGFGSVSEVISANNRLLEAELSLSSGPDPRVAAYQAALRRAKEIESKADFMVAIGMARKSVIAEARLHRTEIEVRLAAEQSMPDK